MSACRSNGRTRPRLVNGRHNDPCDLATAGLEEQCRGCKPCTEPHCQVCLHTHVEGTCAECLAEARAHLHAIAKACKALPAEVVHRGIQGEALMLLGPVADPEARGHVEASYLAGRLPEGWIEAAHGADCPLLTNDACTGCSGSVLHPLTILATWDMQWRDALDHDEPEALDLTASVGYLDRTMSYMAGRPESSFETFAGDLKRCLTHLQSVLHDQERGDRANVGCFDCGGELERRLTKDGIDDLWTCGRCRRRYTAAEYNIALRGAIEEKLEGAAS